MKEIIEIVFNASMFAFAAGSMITVGLGLALSQLIEPFKNIRMVVLSLISNFLVVPLFALGLVWVIPVSEGVRIGIILLSITGGAPFIPMIVATAKGRVGSAVGLMLLLLVTTIFYIPIIVPFVLPDAVISSADIAASLMYSMLIPLALALLVKAYFPTIASRVLPIFAQLTNVSIFLVIITLVYLYTEVIISAAHALPIATLFFIGSMAIGYFTGGKNRHTRIVLSAGTGLRNTPVAMLVASQHLPEQPMATIVPLLVAVIGLLILFPLAKRVGNLATK